MGAYDLRRQPIKAVYIGYQLLTTVLVRVPFWFLISIPRALRPRPSWSVKQCILIKLLRHLGHIGSRVGKLRDFPNHLAIPEDVSLKGVWVDPAPSELLAGPLKDYSLAAGVEPLRIPGYWLDKKDSDISVGTPPSPGEKVLYALHGGAYITLSAHPNDPTAAIAKGFLKHCASIRRAFSIEYRLSRGAPYPAANSFPAALLDALAGYNYLVNVIGFSPSDIIVEGDSAGGNLALALTRHLVENQSDPHVPAPPGYLVLLSPWCDLGFSHDFAGSSYQTNDKTDYISFGRTGYPRAAFIGPFGTDAANTNPYMSPASIHTLMPKISFKGFPRTLIVSGDAEMLLDPIRTLKAKMEEDMGAGSGDGEVTYYEAKDAVHDFIGIPWLEPQRSEALTKIADWLESSASRD